MRSLSKRTSEEGALSDAMPYRQLMADGADLTTRFSSEEVMVTLAVAQGNKNTTAWV